MNLPGHTNIFSMNKSPQFFVELPNVGGKSCVDFMSAPEGIGDSRRIRRLNGEVVIH